MDVVAGCFFLVPQTNRSVRGFLLGFFRIINQDFLSPAMRLHDCIPGLLTEIAYKDGIQRLLNKIVYKDCIQRLLAKVHIDCIQRLHAKIAY